MILTLAFTNGFQYAVSQKVFSIWGHIRVQHYEGSRATIAEELPIDPNDTVMNVLRSDKDISSINAIATRNAILRGNHEDPAKRVRIRADMDTSRLVLDIEDEGDRFDIDAKTRDAADPANLEREDGRPPDDARSLEEQSVHPVWWLDYGKTVVKTARTSLIVDPTPTTPCGANRSGGRADAGWEPGGGQAH